MGTQQGTMTGTKVLFGEWLIQRGLVSQEQLTEALEYQVKVGGRLGEALVDLNILNDDEITKALADYLSMEYHPLNDLNQVDMEVARLLPESVARRHCLVAIERRGDVVAVAMADPLNIVAVDTVTVRLRQQVQVLVSSAKRIQETIEAVYHGSAAAEQSLRDLVQNESDLEQIGLISDEEFGDFSDLDATDANQAPVVRFVDLLLNQAVKSRASDIHIEPQENSMAIRMRVDGILRDMVPPSRGMQAAVITRIKIMSKMDIAERRLPQDGRFQIKSVQRDIDVRVSTIPTIYGEKVVMRILDKAAVNHNIDLLGLEPQHLEKLKRVLHQPHGIMVVTGPTGSGKSTTLYAALNHLKDPTKNIVTVEDPVEYRLAGINQIQVKSDINLDFAVCLRAILRQDPDIIMVGEIRDKETVEIAIKASLTGHMVLSTFHTNDAPSAITRLIHMGIEPYLLASTLNMVLAQRLVRRICDQCKKPVEISEKLLGRLQIDKETADNTTFYEGAGCGLCGGTGYSGRVPIFEFLMLNYEMRNAMVQGVSEAQLRDMSRKAGFSGLMESGVNRLITGLTSAQEVLNVSFEEDII